jgi:hypothetical protein
MRMDKLKYKEVAPEEVVLVDLPEVCPSSNKRCSRLCIFVYVVIILMVIGISVGCVCAYLNMNTQCSELEELKRVKKIGGQVGS